MRNELQQHKKSDKIKWIATAVAFVLLGTAVLATATKGFKDWKPWKDTKQEQNIDENSTQEAGAYDENGNNLADGNVHDMPMKLTFTGAKTLASGTSSDITTNEDGTKEVTVQATLNRDVEMTFDWSVVWTNGTGINVTDYVTVTPESDGSAVATVKMKKTFSKHITLTCESRSITGLKATCAIDCKPIAFSAKCVSFGNEHTFYPERNLTNSSTAADMVTLTVPAVDSEKGTTNYRVLDIIYDTSSTLGSFTPKELFDTVKVEIAFYGLSETSGYGFNSLLTLTEASVQGNAPYYGWRVTLPLTEAALKNAFYYDESAGRTADDFYSYGLALLKGSTNIVTMKCDITGCIKESYGGGTLTGTYYFKLDLTAIEGLSIDINGMEDILF